MLRGCLQEADYTHSRVAERLGGVGLAALERNETTPGRQATELADDRLNTLIRLWLLQLPVSATAAEAALPGLVDRLCVQGVLRRSVGEVAAAIDVRPYATDTRDLWVASDLTPGLDGSPNRVGPDHVLGVSSASTSLAQLTRREPVRRALDLGTGCGVQALHLADHAAQVVATDVNQRALRLTELNLALNDVINTEVRDGSFFDPVTGEEFDLIVTNPPFVISPATGERLVYRDSGLPGDRVVEHIVRSAPRHLGERGWCQILANWAHVEGRPWDERLGEWIEGADALIVQREVLDPAAYVELWLRDAGHQGAPDYVHRYDTWLSWFAEQQITGIGFGWINLVRSDRSPAVESLDWPHAVQMPIAQTIVDWGRSQEWLSTHDDQALLGERLRLRADVRQETYGTPGAEDPEHIVLRQTVGLCRALDVTTELAAVAGASDGDLALGVVLDAVEQLLPGADRTSLIEQVRELVRQGFLVVSQR